MEREPETSAQREPAEDMEDFRDDEERGEQQADARTDDEEIVEDEDEEAPYESDEREGSLGEPGLMD
jgi:hypothetical protein